MTFRTRVRLMVPLSAFALAVSFVGAQPPAPTTNVRDAPLSQAVPVDPLITVGTLPNGLRYYVRANRQPQARAELRLVVNAGSVLEDEDQRGLAHFVEHMSFNGTLHFPKLDVVNFMQSLGMRFGAHVNANTSFDETVYELQIPTDNPAVIDRSLLILEDWARTVSFDPVEIDKERAVNMEARPQSTIGEYRRSIVERLFSGMLSARLDEIAQTPNAPFLRAQTDRGLLVRTEEATSLDALVPAGGVERGLAALFTEINRVARFGFTATELNRQKLNSVRSLQAGVVEKDKSPSGPLADEFIRNFTQSEPIPGIVYEYGLNQRFLPQITLAEVNNLAKEWVPDRNRLVLITAPEKDRPPLPTETKLAAVITAAAAAPLTAYVDTVSTQPLLAPPPSAGAAAMTATNDALGITQWQLSNGVRVVLKPTTFKQDEILFRAVSPGGTSLARDEDFIPAVTAAKVVEEGGL